MTMIEPTSPLIKEAEVAEMLCLKVATLRRWRWSGIGPRYLKLNGAVRYELAAIEAFKKSSLRMSTSDLLPSITAGPPP